MANLWEDLLQLDAPRKLYRDGRVYAYGPALVLPKRTLDGRASQPSLEAGTQAALRGIAEKVVMPRGTELFHEGDKPECCYSVPLVTKPFLI